MKNVQATMCGIGERKREKKDVLVVLSSVNEIRKM